MNRLRQLIADLWNGRVPLVRAFWEYAIVYGSLLALASTVASLALIAGDYSGPLALFVYLLPTPYNVLMIVSVWRSAARYAGPQIWATLARALIIVWAAAATLA